MRLRGRPGLESVERNARSLQLARRKGVLFCPGCGHESHVDGDWVRSDSAGRTNYACPDCGAVVVSQPAFHGPNAT